MDIKGLPNSGSICYLNALVQGLWSCKHLVAKLNDIKTINPVANTLITLTNGDNLLTHIKKKYPNFGNGQESATECLVYLFECINDKKIDDLLMHTYETRIICKKCEHINESVREKNIHFLLFDEADLNTRGMKEYIIEHTNDIPDYNGSCNMCGNSTFKRKYRLKYIPEIAICVLNRYEKRENIVLPDTFSIDGTVDKKMVYKRVAEVEHSGTLHGGHYICKAIRRTGTYLINDGSATMSMLGTTPNTYITFYELI